MLCCCMPSFLIGDDTMYMIDNIKVFALSLAPEVVWSIMASFMLYVVDKYARDFYMYMENANS